MRCVSSQADASGSWSGVTRTPSVHVVSHSNASDASTQTDSSSRFARTLSIVGRKQAPRMEKMDEDVQQLFESCRRYQDERVSAAVAAAEVPVSEEEDEVGCLLADSIETSVRTVLHTVGPRKPSTPAVSDDFEEVRSLSVL